MRGYLTYKSILSLVFIMALSIGTFITNTSEASAEPVVPRLSLVGADQSYDDQLYPDGRIWLPGNIDGNNEREFLVPVFIDNRWFSDDDDPDTKYHADPIKSFKFRMMYDSSSVRAIGVQTYGPLHNEDQLYEDHTPLADGFTLNWHDDTDFTYLQYLLPTPSLQDAEKGRAITITGTSIKPLPNTDLNSPEFKVLLYVRFKVVPQSGSSISTASNRPIYIDHDEIYYNDLNIATTAPFTEMRGMDPLVILDYPDPVLNTHWDAANKTGIFPGLAGISNKDDFCTQSNIVPGVVYLRYFSELPKFGFEINRNLGSTPAVKKALDEFNNEREDLYEVVDPITTSVWAEGNFPSTGRREISVKNIVNLTRISNITIESDQKWLKFRSVGDINTNPGGQVNYATVDYIDNGILGPTGLEDPLCANTNPVGELVLEIICDPSEIEAGDDLNENDVPQNEKTGIYTGHLTFSSVDAEITPVRLQVKFIYFRAPVEGHRAGESSGIKLDMENSNSGGIGGPDKLRLIFGTGFRATSKADLLFGETYFTSELRQDEFDARFYPEDLEGNPTSDFGLDDVSVNDEQVEAHSRDIRNHEYELTSLNYLVKFSDGDDAGDRNYPIILEWDIRDFPDGSELYIRDTKNGALFPSTNMRNATQISATRRSFKIDDPRITEFLIEYTLPGVIDYVDENGEPIIKKGWNLLSLPVKPTNSVWNNVYKNALGKPEKFFLNGYQEEEVLSEGVGYFIKYGNTIDKQFGGTFISEISKDRGNAPRVYPGDNDRGGWNAVGAASALVDVNSIEFDEFNGTLPSTNFTKTHGVWAYNTNAGYHEVSTLRPGLGYWIKVDVDGYYHIEAKFPTRNGDKTSATGSMTKKQSIYSNSSVVTVSDNGQSQTSVYLSNDKTLNTNVFELPPVPGLGFFDVRFTEGTNLSNADVPVLRLNGVQFPISVEISNLQETVNLRDALTGELLGTLEPNSSSSVEIESMKSNAIILEKANLNDLTLDVSSATNPVMNTAVINYTVEADGLATIEVYDELGNKVKTLLNEFVKAGSNTVNFETTEVTSGRYFVRISNNSNNKVSSFTVIK